MEHDAAAASAPLRPRTVSYGLLAGAIGTEVAGSLALAAGADSPAWYAVTAVGYLASFWLLARVLTLGLPLGVAYAIWGATGVALTALGGRVFFGEALTPAKVTGFAPIIAGVALVHLGSREKAPASSTPAPHGEAAPP